MSNSLVTGAIDCEEMHAENLGCGGVANDAGATVSLDADVATQVHHQGAANQSSNAGTKAATSFLGAR